MTTMATMRSRSCGPQSPQELFSSRRAALRGRTRWHDPFFWVRKIAQLLVFLCFGLQCLAAAAPISVHIAAVRERVSDRESVEQARVGEPVALRITITNTSDHEVTLEITCPTCDYELDVRDAQGRLAPDTPLMRQIRSAQQDGLWTTGRDAILTLKPNESCVDKVPLSELSDITHGGEYTIQISRWLSRWKRGDGAVKSNKITLTVTP